MSQDPREENKRRMVESLLQKVKPTIKASKAQSDRDKFANALVAEMRKNRATDAELRAAVLRGCK
jgi:hypothetical protein